MIRTKLMKHQKVILDFADDKKHCAVFADYGTGKSLAALAYIDKQRPKIRKILVVSSKTSIQSTWPDEIRKHTNFRYVLLLGSIRQKVMALRMGLRKSYTPESPYAAAKVEPVLFLVNFDGVRNIYEFLAKSDFDLVIIDESTKIKSPKTLRSKVMWALGRTSKRRWIMTGFPITENLAEIYSQVKFLDFGESFGNNYYAFLNKYFYRAGFKWLAKKGTEKKIFGLIKPFAIRITNDVLKLPPQVYKTEVVEPTKRQIQLLEDLKTYFRIEFGKVKIDTQYIFALINKSLQICDGFIQTSWYEKASQRKDETVIICQHCKLHFPMEYTIKGKCPRCDHEGYREVIGTAKDETLIDVVEEINPKKNKIIIWSVFRFTVKKLKKVFKELGYNVVSLTGSTEDANAVVKKFQSGSAQIMLATQKKASESITLTNCRYAIYYSNSWSYDLRANSEARIRRKGSEKHKSIIYTDIFLKNSIEKMVYDCLRNKKNLVGNLKTEFQRLK